MTRLPQGYGVASEGRFVASDDWAKHDWRGRLWPVGTARWSVRLRVGKRDKLGPRFRENLFRLSGSALYEADLAHEGHHALVVRIGAGEKLAVRCPKLVRVRKNVLLIPNGGRQVAESPAGIVTVPVLPGTIRLGKLGEKPIPKVCSWSLLTK